MKNSYLCGILVALSAMNATVGADSTAAPVAMPPATDSASAATTPEDPTIAFFSALGTCTPGTYNEKNSLSDEIGQQFLTHKILGEDNGMCKATLMTPDSRTMDCSFPMDSLIQVSGPQFLQNISADTPDTTDQNVVNADMVWSQLKSDNCDITQL